MQRPFLRHPVAVFVGLRDVISGVQEQHGHVWNALTQEMQDGHILRLKAAGQTNAGVLLGGEHSVQDLFGRETFYYLSDMLYVHSIHLFLILFRSINEPQRLRKRQDMPRGKFFVAVEFRRAGQVKKASGELRGKAVFCFSSKIVTGIKDDDSRLLRHADGIGKGIAGEFGTTQVQNLEAALEEEALEPQSESRTAFE